MTAEPVVVAQDDRVVVKLNRRAAPKGRLGLIATLAVAYAVAIVAVVKLGPLPVSPLAGAVLWLVLMALSVYFASVESTLVATPATGAYVEYQGPFGPRRVRSTVCHPGAARAVTLRERVDLESDLRPFSLVEVVAETRDGDVVLCALGNREQAVSVARSLSRILGCEVQLA